jgi:hypothetical protein
MNELKTLLSPAVEHLRQALDLVAEGPHRGAHRGALAVALNNASSVLRDLNAEPLPDGDTPDPVRGALLLQKQELRNTQIYGDVESLPEGTDTEPTETEEEQN